MTSVEDLPPKVLDADDAEEAPQAEIEEMIQESQNMRATRDELVAEDLAEKHEDETDPDTTSLAETQNDSETPEKDRPRALPRRARTSRSGPSAIYEDVRDVFLVEFPELASRMGSNLKALVAGKVLIELTDQSEGITLDCVTGESAVVTKKELGSTSFDCKLVVSTRHIADVLFGSLNSQVAMLSEKIRVEGQHSLAVYFFNIFDRDGGPR